jgi:hypothetical protein
VKLTDIKVRAIKPAAKPMKIKIIKILKWLSLGYLFLCLLSLSAYLIADLPTFSEVGHLQHGCYKTDALVPYVQCRGLPANALIKHALNFWYLPVYGIIFLFTFPFAVLSDGYGYPIFSLSSLIILSYGLIVLSPIGYLLWYGLKGRRLI